MDDSNRIEHYKSRANCIYSDRKIIQHDVIPARLEQIAECDRMKAGGGYTFSPASEAAYRTMRRAYAHQPGERGAMTVPRGSVAPRE